MVCRRCGANAKKAMCAPCLRAVQVENRDRSSRKGFIAYMRANPVYFADMATPGQNPVELFEEIKVLKGERDAVGVQLLSRGYEDHRNQPRKGNRTHPMHGLQGETGEGG